MYWFRMGGLDHPYVQLRIHNTILFTSIILSVDYKPLQFTPPIFNNIDAHKEGVTPQRYSALGNHPKESHDSTLPKCYKDNYQTSHRKYQTPTRSPMI